MRYALRLTSSVFVVVVVAVVFAIVLLLVTIVLLCSWLSPVVLPLVAGFPSSPPLRIDLVIHDSAT